MRVIREWGGSDPASLSGCDGGGDRALERRPETTLTRSSDPRGDLLKARREPRPLYLRQLASARSQRTPAAAALPAAKDSRQPGPP
ncbi:hypothetical protein MRX96_005342 [Rhipicephalus microplus]